MANIKLKGLLTEAEDFKARSKETGKLVHFKSKDAYQAAIKAGSHEDPKAEKGAQPKADEKPNDMFGGDYAKDRGGKSETGKVDVKSIVKGIMKTANPEFKGTHKLSDITADIEIDVADADGKELQSRIDKGEDGIYVQTDETEGIVVFSDGSQYKFHHVEDGPIPVTKIGKEERNTSSKSTSMLPKKASELDYEHMTIVSDILNSESGLDGFVDIDDNTGTFMYNAGKGESPTYTLFLGSNIDYNKPNEFRVSLEPTYGNDPAGIEGKVDKSFKSADEAMKYMIAVSKKYKKELEMDDEDLEESTKLTSMIKK